MTAAMGNRLLSTFRIVCFIVNQGRFGFPSTSASTIASTVLYVPCLTKLIITVFHTHTNDNALTVVSARFVLKLPRSHGSSGSMSLDDEILRMTEGGRDQRRLL
jgi:hypothetical protein